MYLYIFTLYIHYISHTQMILRMTFGALASHGFYLNRCVSDIFMFTYIYLHYISHTQMILGMRLLAHSRVTVSTSTGASLIYLCIFIHKEWLRLVGSLKLQVSFAKEPYKRDYILQKRRMILRILLIVANP